MRYLIVFLLVVSYVLAFEALVDPKNGDVIVAREEGKGGWSDREKKEFLILQITDTAVDAKFAAKKTKGKVASISYPFLELDAQKKLKWISKWRVDFNKALTAKQKADAENKDKTHGVINGTLIKGSLSLPVRTK